MTQRSFRLPTLVLERLEQRAQRTGETGNRLAGRLLDEALRRDEHPMIYFRRGRSGGTRPALIGTRLHVSDVVGTIRANDNSVTEAAEYLGLPAHNVQACLAYYADFREEVDEEIQQLAHHAEQERQRWESAQEALAETPPR